MLTEKEIAMCESAKGASAGHLASLAEYNLKMQSLDSMFIFFKLCYQNNDEYVESEPGEKITEKLSFAKLDEKSSESFLRSMSVRNLKIDNRGSVFKECEKKNSKYATTLEGSYLKSAIELGIHPVQLQREIIGHKKDGEEIDVSDSVFVCDNRHLTHCNAPIWQSLFLLIGSELYRPVLSNINRLEEEWNVIKAATREGVVYLTDKSSGRSYFPTSWDGFCLIKNLEEEMIDGYLLFKTREVKACEPGSILISVECDGKKYRQFDYDQCQELVGRKLKSRDTGEFLQIQSIKKGEFKLFDIVMVNDRKEEFAVNPGTLIDKFTFKDGSPAGQLVQ